MDSNKMCGWRVLRIAVGITTLVLLMAGGAVALSDRNILSQNDINNSFIMHRMDAGITSNQGLGGRIQENKNLLPVRSIEKAAVIISANAGWFINDNATGGDCISIGTWNAVSKTCTLATDLNKTIEIDSDSITLDGNGHTITGSSSFYGIYLSGRSGVTIKNTNVMSFFEAIYLYNSSNNTLSRNNVNSNDYNGIDLYSSSNNTLSGNNASNNGDGIVLSDSSNNMLSGNNASNNYEGIVLSGSSNNMLSGNNMNSNDYDGIFLYYSSNNTLSGNNVNSNEDGIDMYSSSNNTLSGNNASNNYYGIVLSNSDNNTLIGNNASNNSYGIYLDGSGNNMLFYNKMMENSFNFGLWGNSDSDFNNQIEYSNTVDGKPIYYVKNANNTVYDSSTNAGIIYCISCLNVTIQDIKLLKNDVGIFFWNTTGSKIQNVTVSNNDNGIVLLESGNNTLRGNNVNSNDYDGIYLYSSSNNTLSGNNASNNGASIVLSDSSNNTLSSNNVNSNDYDGIVLLESGNNTLRGNNVNSNDDGIELWDSSNNTLSDNNALYNSYGIYLYSSSNNTLSGNNVNSNDDGIYLHSSINNNIYNNIFNNTNNLHIDRSVNIWNINKIPGTNIIGGSYLGGNLWANPSGTGFSQTWPDADSDGICDSPYVLYINNIDYLPLTYIISQKLLDSYLPPGASPEVWKAGFIRAMDDYFTEPPLLTKSQLLSIMDAYFS